MQIVKTSSLTMKSLQRRKGEPNGSQRLEEFLEAPCLSTEDNGSPNLDAPVTTPSVSNVHSDFTSPTCTPSSLSTIHNEQSNSDTAAPPSYFLSHSVELQFEIARSELTALRAALSLEKNAVVSLSGKAEHLQKQNAALQSKLKVSAAQLATSKNVLRQTMKQCAKLRKNNVTRRFERLKKKYHQDTEKLQQLPAKLNCVKLEKRGLQKHISKLVAKNIKLLHDLKLQEDVIYALNMEACFADLDYSMFKSCHGSLHHHSTLNMIKRNSTISKWLDGKSTADQTKLLARAKNLDRK